MTGMMVIYLIMLGIKDLTDRRIPVCWLGIGGILSVGIGSYRCIQGGFLWWEMLVGALPGILLLLTAWLSKKAGYADGIVLTELGICLGCRVSTMAFCFSMLLTALLSMALLALGKVRRDTKMPYLTFLAIVFLALCIDGTGTPG